MARTGSERRRFGEDEKNIRAVVRLVLVRRADRRSERIGMAVDRVTRFRGRAARGGTAQPRNCVTAQPMSKTDFPIENLPFGVFDAGGEAHVCTAIEDNIVDLHAWIGEPVLNAFMAGGRTTML